MVNTGPTETSELAARLGLEERTASYTVFAGLIQAPDKDLADSEVGHLATIGADFYIYENADYTGYVIAQQGHAGGDRIAPGRHRAMTYWVTPVITDGIPKLRSWRAALAFITACVDADLEVEWGSDGQPDQQ